MRFPVDVPSAGRSVVLHLRVRRFTCRNAECGRLTFVEQISGLTRRHGQRTERSARPWPRSVSPSRAEPSRAWPTSSVHRSAAARSCDWSTHFPSRKCRLRVWPASTRSPSRHLLGHLSQPKATHPRMTTPTMPIQNHMPPSCR
ncbi:MULTISPECIES: hypothetical protein [unclassified Streptomyces]|uniref:hypothetical protein n=1 Tax=unclassified Streptomyces TaxID=2593676 RepID=UPI003253F10D